MNEIRQKFEAFAKLELGKYPSLYELPDPFQIGPEDEYFEDAVGFAWDAWRAAYQAGEIAMKEKAAKAGNNYAEYMTSPGTPERFAVRTVTDAIRALPLSGAEESKKEEA